MKQEATADPSEMDMCLQHLGLRLMLIFKLIVSNVEVSTHEFVLNRRLGQNEFYIGVQKSLHNMINLLTIASYLPGALMLSVTLTLGWSELEPLTPFCGPHSLI